MTKYNIEINKKPKYFIFFVAKVTGTDTIDFYAPPVFYRTTVYGAQRAARRWCDKKSNLVKYYRETYEPGQD